MMTQSDKSSYDQPCEFGHRGPGFLEFWPDELMMVYHSIAVNHRINFDNCAVGYVEHLLKEVIKIKLHTSDLHRIDIIVNCNWVDTRWQ
jgi:hypothetical protein